MTAGESSVKSAAWHWRIMQHVGEHEIAVASGTCHDRRTMLSEMSRYAVQYAEDGPIRCQSRTGKNRWRDDS